MLRDPAHRTGALIRHNAMLMAREPGPLATRMILPLGFLLLLHPLYEQAQHGNQGVTQAVTAALVTFSLMAMSIAGSAILTERIWHTWERIRTTATHPAEQLAGKAVPVIGALLLQQSIVLIFGITALGLSVAGLPLLVLVVLAWSLTITGLGAALGLTVRSLSALSACYDIGGLILSSLGGALVPLAAMPLWIRHLAPASPGYWAVSALQAAVRGDTARVLGACGIMITFAAAACLVAIMRISSTWGRTSRL
jgi:ABC-2 type transport system permease protein